MCYHVGMEYMTVSEAARELGMSPHGIRDRIERGEMRAERAGVRVWLIPRAAVERWRQLGRQRTGPKPKRQRTEEEGR